LGLLNESHRSTHKREKIKGVLTGQDLTIEIEICLYEHDETGRNVTIETEHN